MRLPLLWVALFVQASSVFAQAPPEPLGGLLDRTGARIENFWDDYLEVTAIEEVRQERRNRDGELVGEQVRSFDYLIVMQLSGSNLLVEESRIGVTSSETDELDGPLLVTNGFSTLLLIFHPYFRNSFTYEWSAEPSGDDALARVDFTAIRGQRSPAVLRLEGRDYPIEWKGSAWIDRKSGMITRIRTELNESMTDLGLHSLTAQTDYQAVTLGRSGLEYWLPNSAMVEASSEHQGWRNEHRFHDYRLFETDTGLEIVGREGESTTEVTSGDSVTQ